MVQDCISYAFNVDFEIWRPESWDIDDLATILKCPREKRGASSEVSIGGDMKTEVEETSKSSVRIRLPFTAQSKEYIPNVGGVLMMTSFGSSTTRINRSINCGEEHRELFFLKTLSVCEQLHLVSTATYK